MIPKKIHYCWFGRNPLPQMAVDCIESWKKYGPDYEIIEWNEDNFDINSNQYAKEAYENKKWAFVSDYARLFALYNHGGVYMDTDMEVLQNLDRFLEHRAFSGFQSIGEICTGIIATEKGSDWIKLLLGYYDDRSFFKPNGELDTTVNVATVTRMTTEYTNLQMDNTYQETDKDIVIYPQEYFCPFDYINYRNSRLRAKSITENTYALHHFMGSWNSKGQKFKKKLLSLAGPRITGLLRKIKRSKKAN